MANKLQNLIQELCPDGVKFVKLGEVTIWDKKFNGVNRNLQKKTLQYKYLLAKEAEDIEDENGDVFILNTGNKQSWTSSEKAGEYLAEGEVVTIPWGGYANVKYYKGKFVTTDNRIATSSDTKILQNKFLYYYLKDRQDVLDSFYRGAGIKHPSMFKVLSLEIPLPPLSIQSRIVEILDNFSSLTAELQAELQARRSQYEYYRNHLLSFDGYDNIQNENNNTTNNSAAAQGKTVKWVKIEDICKMICSGGTPSRSNADYYDGEIPWLRTQEVDWAPVYDTEIKITEEGLKNSSAKLIPVNCVIVAMYGATAAKACINKIELTTNQACCNLQIDEDLAYYKYVFHWICKNYECLKAMGEGSQNNINSQKVKNFPIPLPSLSEQRRIADILDRFEALTTDLQSGLPAEIEARQQQYEYYRNKLLTFND